MFARINYTSTKHVNSRLSNPTYSVHKVKSIRETFIAKLIEVMEDNLERNEEEPPAFKEGGIDLPKIPEEEGIDDSGISDSFSNPDESTLLESLQAPQETPALTLEEELLKHDFPLNSSWDVYTTRPEATEWADKLVKIASFNSVAQFWAIYQHLKLPSYLRYHHDYYVFRSGIEPQWETEDNIEGGRFVVEITKKDRNSFLNSTWLETLLILVNEEFADHENINGCVVQNRRKADKISIWTRDSRSAGNAQTGADFAEALDNRFKVNFQSHKDNARRSSMTKKSSTSLLGK
ncbi:Oidioi.mRNA.OKI2018_I69.PAR.g9941.t1.cds [Oikopleura dioica]|uniref:Oidioi.mRNA.OKI2018_I69.PAR.g9941.t1.cds n=1 Tax=Oikopleura dioica TaxID=34765 RepID=A0ABN7RSA1_OIKDI|nr:Oidioi.mRNA.OKI2018_I69.PAR.g9941.t1.cds [Oikopleura dioica]